jgi:hypothetical protein
MKDPSPKFYQLFADSRSVLNKEGFECRATVSIKSKLENGFYCYKGLTAINVEWPAPFDDPESKVDVVGGPDLADPVERRTFRFVVALMLNRIHHPELEDQVFDGFRNLAEDYKQHHTRFKSLTRKVRDFSIVLSVLSPDVGTVLMRIEPAEGSTK